MTNYEIQGWIMKKGYSYIDSGRYYKNYKGNSITAFIKVNKDKENYFWLNVSMIVESQKDIELIIHAYNSTKKDMIDIANLYKDNVK